VGQMHNTVKTLGAVVAITLGIAAAPANATPISIMVGDDDGYGIGIPDNGATGFSNLANLDMRSAAEAAATDGAQITDVYSAIFPAFGPNTSTVASVFFPFRNHLKAGATLTVDMADFQANTFGLIQVSYNGVVQAGLWNFNDGFQNSVVRSFVLDATAIANANTAGQFVLGLDRSGSGDFIAFDFFRLDGVIPEPASLSLFIVGLVGLGLVMRWRAAGATGSSFSARPRSRRRFA